jgi:hypothetical protein
MQAGHMGVAEFIKLGKGVTQGHGGPGGSRKQRECLSLFQVLLKLTLTYEKGRT